MFYNVLYNGQLMLCISVGYMEAKRWLHWYRKEYPGFEFMIVAAEREDETYCAVC